MIVRLFRALPLVLLLSFAATAQIYVCDFGSAHPRVILRKIVFRTVSPLSQDGERKLRAQIIQESRRIHSPEWAETLTGDTEEIVRQAYQNNGYLKARARAEAIVADRGDLHVVSLVVHVGGGYRYQVGHTIWKGNSAISADELNQIFAIHDGEMFQRQRIANGLDAVRNLYLSHGYINVTMIPYPKVDEARKTVSFEMGIEEGKQFRFGELEMEGIEDEHRRILFSAWSELRGKTYSPERADQFFRHFFTPLRAGVSPKDYTHIYLNELKGTVDYALSLTRNRALDAAIRVASRRIF